MRIHIAIKPGQYQVLSSVLTLMLLQGNQEKEYQEFRKGDRFSVPKCENGYSYAVVDDPDFREEGAVEPKYTKA